jgi:hypothetical protein
MEFAAIWYTRKQELRLVQLTNGGKSAMRYLLLGLLSTISIGVATAGMAATTQVNVTDPKQTNRISRVTPDGHLSVREVPPVSYYHNGTFTLDAASGCTMIAAAPEGKALIVRQVRIDVYADPSPGSNNYVALYADSACLTVVGDVNPGALGQTIVSFDPGVSIPQGSAMYASLSGAVQAETYVDGYSVDPTVAPSANVTAPPKGPHQRH